MTGAGFTEFGLSFESGNQRIIDKYAGKKWNLEQSDVEGLIRMCRDYGLRLSGSYIVGYPDETRDEIENTFAAARRHRAAGLDRVWLACLMPLPGTPLFDYARDNGHLPEDLNIDRMHPMRANLINTPVPPAEIEEIRQRAWEELNSDTMVKTLKSWVPRTKEG